MQKTPATDCNFRNCLKQRVFPGIQRITDRAVKRIPTLFCHVGALKGKMRSRVPLRNTSFDELLWSAHAQGWGGMDKQLRHSDLRLLLAFVADCYKLREFEDFAQHLVDVLPKLISAEHVTYNEMDPHKGKSHNYVNTPELATPAAGDLWEQHMHDHPVLTYIVQTGDCQAVRISDFLTQRQLRARGLHADFYRGLGIEDALCFNLSYQPPFVVGVGLHRTRRFSDRERLIADSVRPHIVEAWRNAKLVSRMQRQLQLANEVIESRGSGVIVCTGEGDVQHITPLARRYVSEYFGVSQALDRHLPEELLRWATHHIAQLSNDDIPAPRLPLVVDKPNKRLVVRLLSNSGATLLLLEEEIIAPDASALQSLGLTRREAEVLGWVAQGKTNSDIGSILSLNPSTIKKHLEHIFLKLGVETRTAAAALAFEVGSAKNSTRAVRGSRPHEVIPHGRGQFSKATHEN